MSAARETYFREGIAAIPKLIELADRNPTSATYGCFDRAYWHYRTADFPSGMYQEAVLPLALAFKIKHPDNPFCGQARLPELVLAGIRFAAKSAHRDGSCDDYFPFERAAGAAAFALYACTEACLELDLEAAEFHDFFKRRARYLAAAGFSESGVLSNHKALIVLALFNTYLVTRDETFRALAGERLAALLGLQSAEGWFPEYDGCDPGYLTFTMDFLAKYFAKSGDESVLAPLERALEFTGWVMHPDGTLGGEYGSRNTFHFMPHGFEIMGRRWPAASALSERFARAAESGRRPRLDDDRLCVHYAYNFLQAWRDFCGLRGPEDAAARPDGIKVFADAGLVTARKHGRFAVLSLKKGTGKVYHGRQLVLSDAGLAGRAADGRRLSTAVSAEPVFRLEGETLIVETRAPCATRFSAPGFLWRSGWACSWPRAFSTRTACAASCSARPSRERGPVCPLPWSAGCPWARSTASSTR
jgi:hypothetical protein